MYVLTSLIFFCCLRSIRRSTATGVVFSSSSSKTRCSTNWRTTAASGALSVWRDCPRGQRSDHFLFLNTLILRHISASSLLPIDLRLQVTIRTYGKFRPLMTSSGSRLLQSPSSLIQPIIIKTEPRTQSQRSPVRSPRSPTKKPVSRRVHVRRSD